MSTERQRHYRKKLNLGQHYADLLTKGAGSWTFIFIFLAFIVIWIAINTYLVFFKHWDPYPFILLNLILSCLAAIQAPVILMSQNREMERDRKRSEQDYYVDRKAEREIKIVQKDLIEIKGILLKQPQTKETDKLKAEIKKIQEELDKMEHMFGTNA